MKQMAISCFEPLNVACNEAFNTLCINLSFAGSRVHKIMVTSSRSSEDKSILSMNMMRTLAELGKDVVLIDADMKRSTIASKYGLQSSNRKVYGLAHYLAGICDMEDIIFETNIQGAYMVPMGCKVSNSLKLLSTPRLAQLLNRLAEEFDMVLVDAPPMGLVIDAAEIAKSCDGTLLVVSYNKVSRRELSESKSQIERTGCKVLGVVINNVQDSASNKKYYN